MSDQDVDLDAVALLTAYWRRDEEGFTTVLSAADDCPWYLTQLVGALAELAGLALEELPGGAADEFLADARRFALELP